MRYLWIVAGIAGLSGMAAAQNAATDRSEFTQFENCEDRDPGDLAPYLQVCKGLGEREIWLPFSEHSGAMAIGPDGIETQLDERPEIGGLDMLIGPVIDWRFAEDATTPYAAIVRYRGMTPNYDADTAQFTGGSVTHSNVLVVIALRETGAVSACNVAYIDAIEVPGANEVAHRVAARYAPGFACGADETMVLDLFSVESLALSD